MLGEVGPTWVLRFLTDNWAAIERAGLPGWMPVEMADSTPKRRRVDVFGCGHYGCVMPTHMPGLVIKISSDMSEAAFVNFAVRLGEWPPGIVKYHALVELPGSFRGRNVSVIWREEAFDVGMVHDTGQDAHAKREFQNYHQAYRNAATFVREASIKANFAEKLAEAHAGQEWAWNNVIWEDGGGAPHYSTPPPPRFKTYPARLRLAAALRICHICFELMENTNYAHEVGAALGFYLGHNVLLADVHMQNIGQVTRDAPGWGPQIHTVITDPGHAVFLG